jgi:hypothetical protein
MLLNSISGEMFNSTWMCVLIVGCLAESDALNLII